MARSAANRDAALRTVLGLRREALQRERLSLAAHERVVQQQVVRLREQEQRLAALRDGVRTSLGAARLDVPRLAELGVMEAQIEAATRAQRERVTEAESEATAQRQAVTTAHQRARAIELVLEHRAAERREAEIKGNERLTAEVVAQMAAPRGRPK